MLDSKEQQKSLIIEYFYFIYIIISLFMKVYRMLKKSAVIYLHISLTSFVVRILFPIFKLSINSVD